MSAIEMARANVAQRMDQPYHKSAIMRGDWDKGSFVQEELRRIVDMAPINEADESLDG